MPDQPRPVWLTREQRDFLDYLDSEGSRLSEVVAAWDAAPSDPTEAVERSILGTFPDLVGVRISLSMDRSERAATACARSVLRALGMTPHD